MLTQVLSITGLILVVLGVALYRESRRRRSLLEWVARHPATSLHWPFTASEHPQVPVAELLGLFIPVPSLNLASAVEVQSGDGPCWLIEFSAMPNAGKTARWFTLIAWHCNDPAIALRRQTEWQQANPDKQIRTLDTWVCRRREGTITTALLEEIFSRDPQGSMA